MRRSPRSIVRSPRSKPRRSDGAPYVASAVIPPTGTVQLIEIDKDLGEAERLQRIDFTIFGKPVVKKNTQKVSVYRGKPVKYSTAAYLHWENFTYAQLADIVKAYERMTGEKWRTIDWTFNMEARFFVPTFGVVDLSALYEGIQDCMKKADIIIDDDAWHLISHDGSGVSKDPDNPRMEISLTRRAPSWQTPR